MREKRKGESHMYKFNELFKLCENFENFVNQERVTEFEKTLQNVLNCEIDSAIIDENYVKYYLYNENDTNCDIQVEIDNERVFLLQNDIEESKIEIVNDSKFFDNLKNSIQK